MKEDQNYASRLKNIFMNSLFLWLFCFHHDSCTSLSLFLLWDHQKSLFSALCACLLHTSLPLCMLLSAAVFVYSPKWLLTRKPHFCFSIQKKFQLSQMMPNYKVLSCVSNKTSVTLWETEKLIFFTFCYRSFRFFTTTVKKNWTVWAMSSQNFFCRCISHSSSCNLFTLTEKFTSLAYLTSKWAVCVMWCKMSLIPLV